MQAGASESSPDEPKPIFRQGEIIGRVYEINRLLGEGGMGQVFEAYDHSLDRRIALKASWPNADHFLRTEAKALAAFQHPALPTVYSIGVFRDIDYIVMERIHGIDLSDQARLRRESGVPYAVADVLQLATAVAEGLSVIHHAGLVHRDIKPENIMIMPNQRVVLMDLGLAMHSPDTVRTVVGTPAYMAREALEGTIPEGRAHLLDVYALGVIIYELLTGNLPRDAPSLTRLLMLHDHEPPSLAEQRADAPQALAELVHLMLAGNPDERPQSMESVLRDLKAAPLEGQPKAGESNLRLLIVDDDPDITKVLGFYARRAIGNVDILTAKNGKEAMEQLHQATPDIMLLDLHMPEMNGIELCMYMQGAKVNGHILADRCAIIAVSAGASDADQQLLSSLGVRHFIEKGQRLGERLESAIKDICGH